MNPELKAEWVAALRSGNYSQAKMALRNEKDQFCCLGVLCDVLSKKGVGRWESSKEFYTALPRWTFVYQDIDSRTSLPLSIQHYLGINSGAFDLIDPEGEETSAMDLNDSYELPFSKIADIIEMQP